ncbi:hypothetical protein B0T10DRAFT_575282 [Thelonectria olida]|uniref:Ricin B lectin domain-containing protein n=1 Tax=Thelonectria olida TaxID=1576542 RepID=A0A9P8W0I0_9HYPO|nr:hypothetical protein B0T10DRAFT_575282 [Thelonectria olida]
MPEETSFSGHEPQYIFKCNIRTELNGKFVDLAGGGGMEPPVIAFDTGNPATNPNQIWLILGVPNKSAVLIQSLANGEYLVARGNGQRLRAQQVDWRDESAHWYIEGGDVHSGEWDWETKVKIRSSKYPDCVFDQEGGFGQGAPMLIWTDHGGPNQIFKLWKR